jgi:hypothetical protein
VASGVRGSAEFEEGQARAAEFAGNQARAQDKLEPEIKQEPFTIRGNFGIGE